MVEKCWKRVFNKSIGKNIGNIYIYNKIFFILFFLCLNFMELCCLLKYYDFSYILILFYLFELYFICFFLIYFYNYFKNFIY